MKTAMRKAGSATLKLSHVLTKIIATLGVFLVACAVSGTSGLHGAEEVFAEAGSPPVDDIQYLYEIGKSMAVINAAENALLAADIEEKKRQDIHSEFEEAGRNINKSREAYEKMSRSPEEGRIWMNFVRALDRWRSDHEEFVRLARAHEKSGTPETYSSMSVQALETNPASLSAAVSALDTAIKVNLERVKERSKMDGSAASVFRKSIGFIIIVAVSAMAVILLGAGLTRRPRKFSNRLPLAIGSYPPAFSPAPHGKGDEKPKQEDSTN